MGHKAFLATAAVAAVVATGLGPTAASAVTGLEIRISVLSPSGAPAPGVEVVSLATDAAVRTDAYGKAVVHDATGAWQSLAFTAALDASSQHLAGPTGWAPTSRNVPAPVDGVSRVTLRFTLGAAVAGTLVDARTGGPLAGAAVLHQQWDGTVGGVDTDAAGRYLLPNLPAGRYGGPFSSGPPPSVQAPHGHELLTLGGNGALPHRAGQVTDLGTTRLRPLVQISGTVTDAAGQGVEDQPVQVDDLDGDPGTHTEGGSPRGQTGGGGGFSLTIPWSATPYRQVCAWSAGATTAHPAGLALRCVTSHAAALTFSQNLVLAAGGAVRGAIVGLAADETVFPEVVVRVNGEDVEIVGGPTARVYRIAGLPTGTRVVTVTTSRGTFSSKPVVVRADQTTAVPPITVG